LEFLSDTTHRRNKLLLKVVINSDPRSPSLKLLIMGLWRCLDVVPRLLEKFKAFKAHHNLINL
jgi:hypothetical protein